jgi:ubiquinone/menaquinone biosynthesis C-methylase UbiE
MTMTPSTDPQQLLTFWHRVVDPHGVGLPTAIATDLAAYTGEAVDVVLAKMARGKLDFKRLWQKAGVSVDDSASVAAFYKDQFVEAYELANWHAGLENGEPPLGYALAASLARTSGGTRALDFGSGIGTGAMCLAAAGCEVECADVADALLDFVADRMARHHNPVRTIRLSAGEQPRPSYYDVITCFDVLEHVPDQYAKLRELESFLRPGGFLVINLLEDSSHPDRPMHVSSAGDRLQLIRRTSLRPDWTNYGEIQVLRKARFGRPLNAVASCVDHLQRRRPA